WQQPNGSTSTAGSTDCVSCIPEAFAGLKNSHRGDHFGTKYNLTASNISPSI
ncbi:Hypothetical predicted protein, partial [Paramuricea clavata]